MNNDNIENEEEEEQHVLSDFLRERLTALGLDFDTYGPYVLPLLTDDEHDDDEWESVLELLQASSETHSDDVSAWKELRTSIEQQWQHHQSLATLAAQKHDEERAALYQEKLQEEREQMQRDAIRAAEAQAAGTAPPPTTTTTSSSTDDAAKRALLARYAYENPDEDEDADDSAATEPVLTNRQVAAQAKEEAAREMRGKSVQTKMEERSKTKAAKQEKVQAKEERRQRATKGERKR